MVIFSALWKLDNKFEMLWHPPTIQGPQESVYDKCKGTNFLSQPFLFTYPTSKLLEKIRTCFQQKKPFRFRCFGVVYTQPGCCWLAPSFSGCLFSAPWITYVQGTAIEKTYLKLIDFGLSKRFTPGSFASTKAGGREGA